MSTSDLPIEPAARTAAIGGCDTTADAVARRLLDDLGVTDVDVPCVHALHPDLDWARSGAARLSGSGRAPIAACMRGAFAALDALAGAADLAHVDAPALLGERAAHAMLEGRGRTTAGGHGRLMRARDGWLAVQLPRPEDIAALPAWLTCEPETFGPASPPHAPCFERIEVLVAQRDVAPLVRQARLLGLAIAALPECEGRPRVEAPPSDAWVSRTGGGSRADARIGRRRLRVLDLSTLWAGPLCGRLLAIGGADVVKVEHPGRVDGARRGAATFFDALNGDKQALALDPTQPSGRALLTRLVERADVVIESARPRALAQLGIDAAGLVAAHPGLTWVSITGYGRRPPADAWVAFGDDAAVAAGLVDDDDAGRPRFCGDAIADPLTGMHAAVAALAGAHVGGGLYDVPLYGVARSVRTTQILEAPLHRADVSARPPRRATSRPIRRAAQVGAHTDAVLARWGVARTAPRC